MSENELIIACLKKDKIAQKHFFEENYSLLSSISLRYTKNKTQANEVLMKGFSHLFSILSSYNTQHEKTLQEWIKKEFILFVVSYIKNIRNEYYVSSTVRANVQEEKTMDLFSSADIIDFSKTNFETLIKSLNQLVPSQRLVFNLHVVDEFSLKEISDILETSEQTIKSNLEKSRFHLQQNIEKNYKALKHEQSV